MKSGQSKWSRTRVETSPRITALPPAALRGARRLPGSTPARGPRDARARARWYSRTTSIAIGAACLPPAPPCSTSTTIAISGDSRRRVAGEPRVLAVEVPDASRPRRRARRCATTCAVPVLPAMSTPRRRARGTPCPPPRSRPTKSAFCTSARFSGRTSICRRTRGANSCTTVPSLVSTARTSCGW